MTPPAKKAAATKSTSLTDLLKNKDDNNHSETEVETPPVVDNDDDGDLEDTAAQDENPKDDSFLTRDEPVVVEQYGKKFHFDKTPADLAAETPEESAARYGLSSEVPDHLDEDPNVQISKEYNLMNPGGGTHLHPDIARDNYNRPLSVGESGVVNRTVSEHVFAGEAEVDDKGINNEPPYVMDSEVDNDDYDRDE